MKLGRMDGAIAAYRNVIELDPRDATARGQLGNALGRAGQLGAAVAAYRKALEQAPDDDAILYNLGVLLQCKGQLDEAIAAYQRAVKLRPDFFDSWIGLGRALIGAWRLDEAITAFEQALALSPDPAVPRKGIEIARREKRRGASNASGITALRGGGLKKIIQTGDRYGFNGASVNTPRGRLLVFRRGDYEHAGLRYRWLDEQGGGGLLPGLYGRGDPRLAWHGQQLMLVNNYIDEHGGDRIEMHQVLFSERAVSSREIARFETVRGMKLERREKNWCPFSVGSDLYFEYSLRPRIVLKYDQATHSLQSAVHAPAKRLPFDLAGASHFRLSVPAVPLQVAGEPVSFLGVFHALADEDYYSGFYRFSGRPPFEMIAMSKSPILWPEDAQGITWRGMGKGFRVWNLFFIQSLEVDEGADSVVMFGGENEQACVRIEMKLSAVLAEMEPVT